MNICEFCGTINDNVTEELNPWNDCEYIFICDKCFESHTDSARERQSYPD